MTTMTSTRKLPRLPDGVVFALCLVNTGFDLWYLARHGTAGFSGVWHLTFLTVFAFLAGAMLVVWRRRL